MEPHITHQDYFAGLGGSFTLSYCRKLCELQVTPPCTTKTAGVDFLLSITSIEIQKMIVRLSSIFRQFPVGHTYWVRLDDVLCQLVDRPEYYKLQLEVEFSAPRRTWDEESDLNMYLPRFHEKGWVRFVGVEYERAYYSDFCAGRGDGDGVRQQGAHMVHLPTNWL
jgi:hypothetical protein